MYNKNGDWVSLRDWRREKEPEAFLFSILVVGPILLYTFLGAL